MVVDGWGPGAFQFGTRRPNDDGRDFDNTFLARYSRLLERVGYLLGEFSDLEKEPSREFIRSCAHIEV